MVNHANASYCMHGNFLRVCYDYGYLVSSYVASYKAWDFRANRFVPIGSQFIHII